MNEILAILLLGGGGFFIYSRIANGSVPSFDFDGFFKEQEENFSEKQVNVIYSRIQEDIDVLARTIWGEARGQGYSGMQAVASVVINRLKAAKKSPAKARQFGRTITEICKKPYQFSVWNKGDPNRFLILEVDESDSDFRMAKKIAALAVNGNLSDNTGGADHYLNIKATMALRGGTLPNWVDLSRKTIKIRDHTFLKLA